MKIYKHEYHTHNGGLRNLLNAMNSAPWLFTPSGSRVYAPHETVATSDYDFIVHPTVYPMGQIIKALYIAARMDPRPSRTLQYVSTAPQPESGQAYDKALHSHKEWVDVTSCTQKPDPVGSDEEPVTIAPLVYIIGKVTYSASSNEEGLWTTPQVNLIFSDSLPVYLSWLYATKYLLNDAPAKVKKLITASKDTRVAVFQSVRDLYFQKFVRCVAPESADGLVAADARLAISDDKEVQGRFQPNW